MYAIYSALVTFSSNVKMVLYLDQREVISDFGKLKCYPELWI